MPRIEPEAAKGGCKYATSVLCSPLRLLVNGKNEQIFKGEQEQLSLGPKVVEPTFKKAAMKKISELQKRLHFKTKADDFQISKQVINYDDVAPLFKF